MNVPPDDIMNRVIRHQIDRENARIEAIARAALHAVVSSMEAHTAALGRAEYPGPGWWQISHIQHRQGKPARVVLRYVLPYKWQARDDARRAAEPAA